MNPSQIFEVDWQDRTAFHLAAYYGAIGAMKAMVELLSSSPDETDEQIEEDKQKKVRLILSSKGLLWIWNLNISTHIWFSQMY